MTLSRQEVKTQYEETKRYIGTDDHRRALKGRELSPVQKELRRDPVYEEQHRSYCEPALTPSQAAAEHASIELAEHPPITPLAERLTRAYLSGHRHGDGAWGLALTAWERREALLKRQVASLQSELNQLRGRHHARVEETEILRHQLASQQGRTQ